MFSACSLMSYFMKGLDYKQPSGNPSGQTTAELISVGRELWQPVKYNYENRKNSSRHSGRNCVVSTMRPRKYCTLKETEHDVILKRVSTSKLKKKNATLARVFSNHGLIFMV